MSVYTTPPTKTGTLPFLVPGANKKCFTSYKIFGDHLTGLTPVVLLHGGPGLSHDYMLSYVHPLFLEHNIPLVLYDQIGNAGSVHLPEKKGDEELFHRELENLLGGLGLEGREGGYVLLGHSWGGMMGSTFAAGRPAGLRGLVVSNSPAEVKPWLDAYWSYRGELFWEVQDVMTKHEEDGTTDGDEYQGILMNKFFKEHMCTVVPWPDELAKSMEVSGSEEDLFQSKHIESKSLMTHIEWGSKDETVAVTMNGPNEFENGGSQRDWSASERMKNVNVPTLIINGTSEGATDEAVRPFVEGIKGAKWAKLEHSTHMPMYEEPEMYFKILVEFLES